jgi:hypothetical protein
MHKIKNHQDIYADSSTLARMESMRQNNSAASDTDMKPMNPRSLLTYIIKYLVT